MGHPHPTPHHTRRAPPPPLLPPVQGGVPLFARKRLHGLAIPHTSSLPPPTTQPSSDTQRTKTRDAYLRVLLRRRGTLHRHPGPRGRPAYHQRHPGRHFVPCKHRRRGGEEARWPDRAIEREGMLRHPRPGGPGGGAVRGRSGCPQARHQRRYVVIVPSLGRGGSDPPPPHQGCGLVRSFTQTHPHRHPHRHPHHTTPP